MKPGIGGIGSGGRGMYMPPQDNTVDSIKALKDCTELLFKRIMNLELAFNKLIERINQLDKREEELNKREEELSRKFPIQNRLDSIE